MVKRSGFLLPHPRFEAQGVKGGGGEVNRARLVQPSRVQQPTSWPNLAVGHAVLAGARTKCISFR